MCTFNVCNKKSQLPFTVRHENSVQKRRKKMGVMFQSPEIETFSYPSLSFPTGRICEKRDKKWRSAHTNVGGYESLETKPQGGCTCSTHLQGNQACAINPPPGVRRDCSYFWKLQYYLKQLTNPTTNLKRSHIIPYWSFNCRVPRLLPLLKQYQLQQ